MRTPVTEPKHLDDHELRRELVRAHQLHPIIERRGLPVERDTLRHWMAELDGEYLRRFPHAARRWPWPRTELPKY
jgi:hypothetical protein